MAIIPLLRIQLDSGHPVCEASVFVFPGNFFDELEGVEVSMLYCGKWAACQAWVDVPAIYEFPREAGFIHEGNFPNPAELPTGYNQLY
eukprot:9285344-Ditylum_brightwellii.AAC.1